MNVKGELQLAVASNQKVSVRLHSGEVITGVAEAFATSSRAKIRTEEGPMWVPFADVEHVSRVISMFR